jgi:hypothetical protein
LATHYETLGVARSATVDEIRRAYHVQARRWHPDRSANQPAGEVRRAEDAMRRVNEAWRVLGDDRRRREYDRVLDGRDVPGSRSTAARPASGPAGDGSPPRIDPRLLDPEYLAARRYAQIDQIERGHAVFLRSLPWLAVLGLLAAIVIFSAYQNGPDDEATAGQDATPGVVAGRELRDAPNLPAIGVSADACVRVLTGPSLQEVPCTGPSDGSVVAVALDETVTCPAPSTRKVVLRNGAVVCLGPRAT